MVTAQRGSAPLGGDGSGQLLPAVVEVTVPVRMWLLVSGLLTVTV